MHLTKKEVLTLKNSVVIHNNKQPINAKLYQYSLALHQPLLFNHVTVKQRQGLIIELKFSDGSKGFGDIAPLPGFSKETLRECQPIIQDNLTAIVSNRDALHSLPERPPSLAFALDCALLGSVDTLPSNVSKANTSKVDDMCQFDSTPMLQGNKEQVIKQFKQLDKNQRVKLKVARASVDDDIEVLNALYAINPTLHCILDANQGWSLDQATTFAKQVPTHAIDYIEEPCVQLEDCMAFSKTTGIALGLDETLQNPKFRFEPNSCVKALIIKPTLIGRIQRCKHLIEQANSANIRCYISSSFESSIGLKHLSYLAKTYCPGQATGLDTIKFFAEDIHITSLTTSPVKSSATRDKTALQASELELIWQC